jgi:hypothetical protein
MENASETVLVYRTPTLHVTLAYVLTDHHSNLSLRAISADAAASTPKEEAEDQQQDVAPQPAPPTDTARIISPISPQRLTSAAERPPQPSNTSHQAGADTKSRRVIQNRLHRLDLQRPLREHAPTEMHKRAPKPFRLTGAQMQQLNARLAQPKYAHVPKAPLSTRRPISHSPAEEELQRTRQEMKHQSILDHFLGKVEQERQARDTALARQQRHAALLSEVQHLSGSWQQEREKEKDKENAGRRKDTLLGISEASLPWMAGHLADTASKAEKPAFLWVERSAAKQNGGSSPASINHAATGSGETEWQRWQRHALVAELAGQTAEETIGVLQPQPTLREQHTRAGTSLLNAGGAWVRTLSPDELKRLIVQRENYLPLDTAVEIEQPFRQYQDFLWNRPNTTVTAQRL